jgi:DNA mismatch repair ATPase MutS
VRYLLTVKGGRVEVSRYEGEADYSAEIERTFEKFKRSATRDYRTPLSTSPWMDHVEAAILDLVARLYPDVFLALEAFCRRHRDYLDKAVATFDREVQFYVAYLDYIERFKAARLRFCYPRLCDQSQEVYARDAFDVALADTLIPEHPIVRNDFEFTDPERVIVVSGPNQGGKTTFARMFGQLHFLASIGCLVPGSDARLFLYDRLFSHFEREEDLKTLSGKLEDDLLRMHEILSQATPRSIVIMNESLTATTLRDASMLGKAVLEQMIARGLLCVYVTFVDELASLGPATVSMVSTVAPEDPATRTYKIVRRPADGLAYAYAIAEKYGLTYARLKERLAP